MHYGTTVLYCVVYFHVFFKFSFSPLPTNIKSILIKRARPGYEAIATAGSLGPAVSVVWLPSLNLNSEVLRYGPRGGGE